MIKSFICGVSGVRLTNEEREFLAVEQPYGVILFARNIESPTQVAALTAEIRTVLTHPYAEILVDQEGGRVARLRPPHWRAYPSAQTLSRMADASRAVYVNARLIAQELRAVGITMDCAPVADVLAPECHAIIGDRAFGETAEQVARLARAQSEALLDGGILSILKHIPGHGRATMDSHETLPVVSAPLAALEACDFAVFKALNDLPLAMTAHILYPALDAAQCATFSPIVLRYIREEIGFSGLIMSDDLSMKALGGSFAERTERSLEAGCDLVLHGNGALVGEPVRDLMAELRAVAASSVAMSTQSLARAEAAANQRRTPHPAEEGALLAEWQQVLAVA
ncbi:MAG: beta-N-acetylhexosaminidase [Alphaproteobacteria bacterium]|nr:beta-N-acetylhexosaminidase [Alphaproteobacteria bacterium]